VTKSKSYAALSPKQGLLGNTKEITKIQNKYFKILFLLENTLVCIEIFFYSIWNSDEKLWTILLLG